MNPRLQPSTRVLWALLLVAVSACSRTNDGWIEFEWPTDTAATSFDSVPTDTAPSSGESAGLPLDSGSSAHDSALPPDTGVELTDSTSGSGESGRDPRDSGAQDSGGDDEPESAPGTPSQDSDSDSPIDSAVRDSTLAADSTADTSSPETGEAPPIDSAGADSSRPRGDTGSAESADTCADSGSSDTSSDTADPDADGDGYPASADCDDGFAGAHPGADERCDLVDDDCDGTVDIGAIDADTWATLLGGASGDRFGAALLDAGDLDGDGYDDLVVGSPGADPSGVDAGMVELIPGSALGGEAYSQDIAVATYAGLPDTAELGAALAAGDLDGDGVTDLVAGEPGSARAHLFTSGWATTSGSTDLAVATLTGSTGDGLGGTLLAADLDADGLDDLAVCAPDRRSSTGICWTIAGIDLIDGAASSLASGSVGGDDPGDRLGTAAAVGEIGRAHV